MKTRITRRGNWLAVAAFTLSLAACGGSNNGDGLTNMQREDHAASASAVGLFNFARTQIDQATNETSEPRAMSGITATADETSEPFSLM